MCVADFKGIDDPSGDSRSAWEYTEEIPSSTDKFLSLLLLWIEITVLFFIFVTTFVNINLMSSIGENYRY